MGTTKRMLKMPNRFCWSFFLLFVIPVIPVPVIPVGRSLSTQGGDKRG